MIAGQFMRAANKFIKDVNKTTKAYTDYNILNEEEARKQAYAIEMNKLKHQFEVACDIAIVFKEVAIAKGIMKQPDENKVTQTFFITVRPDCREISFKDFYEKTMDFKNRNCFLEIHALTFEQKGTDVNSLGNGFHFHMLAKMTCRSKGEVLRLTQSTFKKSTAAHCIDVKVVKTQDDITKTTRYMTDYESVDGHKIMTKEWDAMWRQQVGIESIYMDCVPATIKSDVAGNTRIEEIA